MSSTKKVADYLAIAGKLAKKVDSLDTAHTTCKETHAQVMYDIATLQGFIKAEDTDSLLAFAKQHLNMLQTSETPIVTLPVAKTAMDEAKEKLDTATEERDSGLRERNIITKDLDKQAKGIYNANQSLVKRKANFKGGIAQAQEHEGLVQARPQAFVDEAVRSGNGPSLATIGEKSKLTFKDEEGNVTTTKHDAKKGGEKTELAAELEALLA